MKYKTGDTVILTKNRPDGWNSFGAMDEFLGARVVIEEIIGGSLYFIGDKQWNFNVSDINKKVNGKTKLYKYLMDE